MPKFAAKVDDNQPLIVSALRKVGAKVESMAGLGRGVPDLLVAYKGDWYVMEVKDGSKPLSARCLTMKQREWIVSLDNAAKVHVVETPEEAIKVLSERGQG